MVGYLIFRQFMSDAMFGFLFAAVAGIMVFISLDELLPTASIVTWAPELRVSPIR